MQNAADRGAVAGAKLRAQTVVSTSGGIRFRMHQEDVCCAARHVADANRSFRPANEPETILVWGSVDKTTWTPLPRPTTGGCPAPGNLVILGTVTNVDPATAFVRVQADLTYRGLFGAATGQSTVTAGATAVAHITGARVSTIGYTWPTMRHFNVNDFKPRATPRRARPSTRLR